ncbi:DUF3341 domain-containing protein [Gluconacetobacter tumulicola]|uniref:DUF3341 domain-containing protein n=1 Tax=Gluconacetobacter tumulicola TaxID=1017177 RepID=A0A7W4JFX3_9PROT|nr:DUF3341 domain-containing protein [Gluconacetobacter tumulicola]MBB2180317.1 DUF3341 domain-containing protein [Gluconacetobacter tumulicola]
MIVAAFATEKGMREAAAEMRHGDCGFVETYMAMEPWEAEVGVKGGSVLPAVMLGGGIVGGLGGFLMQAYATTVSYPQNIGGRPDLSWPSYVPATFELAVLGAVVAGMAGFLLLAGMPRLYEPADEADCMRGAMLGSYVLVVRPADSAEARRVLARHAPIGIKEVAE